MNSPIIIFNPEGLTDDQVNLIKQALDDAYRAGYETAKELYQLKIPVPSQNPPTHWGTFGNDKIVYNQCSNGTCGCESP